MIISLHTGPPAKKNKNVPRKTNPTKGEKILARGRRVKPKYRFSRQERRKRCRPMRLLDFCRTQTAGRQGRGQQSRAAKSAESDECKTPSGPRRPLIPSPAAATRLSKTR